MSGGPDVLLPAGGPVAGRDPVTGLGRREELLDRAPALLARAAYDGRAAVLLVLDLDGFKEVNDVAGHHAGDHVLAAVGARLRAATDVDDVVVRLGGDEFAVLSAAPGSAARRADAVVDALSAPMEFDDLRLTVGVSLGLATTDHDGSTLEELMRAADQAMYVAKRDGTGRWRASTPEEDGQGGRAAQLLAQLLAGLESGRVVDELVVHYQPQVSLDPVGAEPVVGFEALVRWDHPDHGLLLPRQFIPLAERSGLMAQVTAAVLERSLTDLATLQAHAPGARLSLNVTRRHILGRGLVDDLATRVRRHGVSPHHVVLEITEPVTRATSETAATFADLSRRGFEVSIRGFGTARSSLTALWSNPAVREVKLDPSIVEALHRGEVDHHLVDPEAVRLLRALTSAAHGLGIRVVAEGVEDRTTAVALRGLACDVLQGYWLGGPIGVGAVADWCADWPGRRPAVLGVG